MADNENDLRKSAEYLQLPAGLVEAPVTYYGDFREEIDEEIALNEDEWRRGQAASEAGRRALEA